MVFVGEGPQPSSQEAQVYELVALAQEAVVRAAWPGMTCESLDAVARDYLTEVGAERLNNASRSIGRG
jgi:Xaa-Pro aminopeptidase